MRSLRDVDLVDVQFAAEPYRHPDLETLAVLERSSRTVSGVEGPAKPLMSDIFDALAAEARRRRLPYFCFTNADIHISQAAVDRVLGGGGISHVFSREDFDRDGRTLGMELAGIDVFAVATDWWPKHRHRFRPYIAAEGMWDNVYASILLIHANATIENRGPMVRHEAHPRSGETRRNFVAYSNYLASLDAWYFDRWCKYWGGLVELRREGADEAAEHALRQRVFTWPPSLRDRALQAARFVRAACRYYLRPRGG
ncbi:MAG TPA: hypothetical protein VM364_11840 [Vicinamibacterales bacterium]|nr:hypothetical protein [Vicinamibacterales bacterium]